MAKTKPTDVSVDDFLSGVSAAQRDDSYRIVKMMREITGAKPTMWGPTIIGFGEYHYVYDTGHEGDTCLAGFSPRKTALVIYFNAGLEERYAVQIKKLGKAKVTKGCLYIKKLADIDFAVLRAMVEANVAYLAGTTKPKSKPAAAKSRRKT